MAEEKQGGKIITPLGWDIKRNAKGQFVPNNEQLRKLVYDKNIKLSEIDTSEIMDMSYLFAFVAEDEEDDELFWKAIHFIAELYFKREDFSGIAGWDTSKATTFECMFFRADNFNEDISKWDTSSATNMVGMFAGAESFNQNLSAWGDKLGKVQNMKKMFQSTALNIDFISSWKIPEDCDISEMTEASGLENKGTEKAEFLNFVIHKINIDESMLQGFSKNDSFIKSWLPESLLGIYEVFLVRYDDKSGEWSKGDEKAWDFAFCKVLGSWFAISKVINSNNDKVDKALPPYISKTLPFRIYQGQSVETLKKSGEFDETNMYDTKQGLAFNFEQSKMRILNTAFYDMSDRVRDIVFAVVLAKAYNIKMENLSEKAKSGSTKEIQQCHTEVCEFDLKEYRSIPITQSGESGNGVLTEVWLQIFNVCLVGHKHDELKEAITQMARILTDNKRDSQSWWFSVAAVAIAFVSFVVAAISAVPVIEKWLG